MSRVLLVEDEEHLAEGLIFNLRNAGYHVEHVDSGEDALATAGQGGFDLILLDVMLPGVSGFEVARTLRRRGDLTPILMLTARGIRQDTIEGLNAGADDYITKPFDLDELLARIRGTLRRQVWNEAQSGRPGPLKTLRYGSWTVDFASYTASHQDGEEISLSAKEIAMLKLFGERDGEVVSREEFLEEVWGLPGSLETRTVDNYIRKLRVALEEDPRNPRHIISVRGAGYKFVE